MYLGTPAYAPTILYAQNQLRGMQQNLSQSLGATGTWQPGIYRLVHLLEGQHQIRCRGQTLTCNHGAFYLLQPNGLDSIQAGRGSVAQVLACIIVRLPGAELQHERGYSYRLAQLDHSQPDPQAIWGHAIPTDLDEQLCSRIKEPYQFAMAMSWRDPWRRSQADQLLGKILLTIATHYRRDSQLPAPAANASEHIWLRHIESLIAKRLSSLHTTKDIADMVGISQDHFAREFTKLFHVRPAAFLRQRRLDRCAELLHSTNFQLADIARETGFRDETALAHAWKRAYGLSPGRWRRLQQHDDQH